MCRLVIQVHDKHDDRITRTIECEREEIGEVIEEEFLHHSKAQFYLTVVRPPLDGIYQHIQ